jgi:ribonuclease HI
MSTERKTTRKTTASTARRAGTPGGRSRKAKRSAAPPAAEEPAEAGVPAVMAGGNSANTADTLPTVALYADGACSGNPGPGGWGAILVSPASGKRLEISGADLDTTNNRMEMIGVIEGLRRLKARSRVRVVTDSRYVVDGMKSWIFAWRRNGWLTSDKKPVKNRDLWELLSDLSREHETAFEWVRGHEGHAENERCDAMARAAIDTARKLAAGPRRPATR